MSASISSGFAFCTAQLILLGSGGLSGLAGKSNAEFFPVQKCHHKSGRCICEIKRGVKKGFKRWFCLGYCQRSVLLTFFNFKTGFRVLFRVLIRVLIWNEFGYVVRGFFFAGFFAGFHSFLRGFGTLVELWWNFGGTLVEL